MTRLNIISRFFEKIQMPIFRKEASMASYNYLMNNLSNGMVIPYNLMSISPPAMMTIINHVLINDVKYIVEFGSGVSTIFLNNLSVKNNLNLNIMSVDDDKDWQGRIKETYKLDKVQFIYAPLETQMQFKGKVFPWYTSKELNALDKSKVDFVIIDGPVGKQSPYERAGAFEFFKSELNRKNFSCLLDDTNYKELKEIMDYYCPNSQTYAEFSIYGAGIKYQIEPVTFRK